MLTAVPRKKVPQSQNIKVIVRIRPVTKREEEQHAKNVLKVQTHRDVYLRDKKYSFDRVFKPCATQLELYTNIVAPFIKDVIMGYNCTVFAYGQTGTGKTYTMTGDKCYLGSGWRQDDESGIIPRTAYHIFEELTKLSHTEVNVKVSYIELYNEEIRDLLADEDNVLNLFNDSKGMLLIQGLNEVSVRDSEGICKLLQKGIIKRQTASTLLNHQSSRSHTCFTITVTTSERQGVGDEDLLKTGKINLVDLAGSENIARAGCKDLRAQELMNINRSLLTLGRVIQTLADKSSKHVPYRDSKLTRILQDSLGGHTKTAIIATVSPASSNIDETTSTLDYATRARDIKNNPIINEKYSKNEMVEKLLKEIEALQKDLDAARAGTGFYVNKDNFQQMLDAIQILTGEDVTPEELEIRRVERIHELKSIIALKLQQFEETVNECKKHKQELEKAKTEIEVKEEYLQQEKYLSQRYEKVSVESVSKAKQLLKTTTILKNEKELLLAKLENQFAINSKNEIVTKKGVNELLKNLDEIKTKSLDHFHSHHDKESTLKNYIIKGGGDLEVALTQMKNLNSNFKHNNCSIQTATEPIISYRTNDIKTKINSFKQNLVDANEHNMLVNKYLNSLLEHHNTLCKDVISMALPLFQSDVKKKQTKKVLEEINNLEQELIKSTESKRQQRAQLESVLSSIDAEIEENVAHVHSLRSLKNDITCAEEKIETENEENISKLENLLSESSQKITNEASILPCKTIITDELEDVSRSVHNFAEEIEETVLNVDKLHKKITQENVENIIEPTIKHCDETKSSLESIVKSVVDKINNMSKDTTGYEDEFYNYIDTMQETLVRDVLEKNIKIQHAGDTPSRQTLEYPKLVEELTPREALIKQFKLKFEHINENGEDDGEFM